MNVTNFRSFSFVVENVVTILWYILMFRNIIGKEHFVLYFMNTEKLRILKKKHIFIILAYWHQRYKNISKNYSLPILINVLEKKNKQDIFLIWKVFLNIKIIYHVYISCILNTMYSNKIWVFYFTNVKIFFYNFRTYFLAFKNFIFSLGMNKYIFLELMQTIVYMS